MSDRLAAGEDADSLAADVLDVVLAGLKSGVALHSKAVADCPLEETAVTKQAS
jgi:hypothetical protein